MDKKTYNLPLNNLPNKKLVGTRAKTFNALMDTAMHMLEEGWFPSITELAEAAGVSRATAYRYFPTQSDLVAYVVDESLGPIKTWESDEKTVSKRIEGLLHFTYRQLEMHEGALRAALQVSLQQWAATRAQKPTKVPLVRGNRRRLLAMVASPWKDKVSEDDFNRFLHGFSVIYGTEVFLVLKDIWGLELDEIQNVVQWMGKAMVRQFEEEHNLSETNDEE